MGVPLMRQEADARRIGALKKALGARSKVEVVRTALVLLERRAEREERVRRWERAAAVARTESRRALEGFRPHTRLEQSE